MTRTASDGRATVDLPTQLKPLLNDLLEQLGSATAEDELTTNGAHARDVVLDIHIGDYRCVVYYLGSETSGAELSPRELEIARMVAKGYPNKTIAAILDISAWTVNTHLRRMFGKVGVHSRAALVANLSRDGFL